MTGYLFTFLAALCFGSYGVWSRLMGKGFDPFFQGWTRALIISLLIIPILLKRRELTRIAREDVKWFAIFIISTAFTQAPLYYAFNHMDIGSAHLIFYVAMLLAMYAVGFTLFSERWTSVKIISLISAVLGLMLVYSISLERFTILAAFMAVLNGIASGVEVAISKKVSSRYSALYITLISWLAILVTNLPVSYFIGESFPVPDLNTAWLYQFVFSVVSLFGFWFAIIGFRHIDSSTGSLVLLLEIVFAVSFGAVLFSEDLGIRIVAGAFFILLAGALPCVQEKFRQDKLLTTSTGHDSLS